MKITIEVDNARGERLPDFLLDGNRVVTFNLMGKDIPFLLVSKDIEMGVDGGGYCGSMFPERITLKFEEIVVVETEDRRCARLAVKHAEDVVDQAKKSPQCAKDVLKNMGAK